MALSDSEILNIVGQELQQSTGGDEQDALVSNYKAALASYLGQPNGREQEGRSSIVSTDVADAVEWLKPAIIDAFTRADDVVTFEAVGPDDEEQAELETKFVYDCLMKENAGFNVLYTAVHDALLQKNGVVMVYWEERECVTTESYTGLTAQEVEYILGQPNVEPVQRTEREDVDAYATQQEQYQMAMAQWQQQTQQIPFGQPVPPPPQESQLPLVYDIKVKVTEVEKGVKIDCVAPEDFRIARMHNNLDPRGARFCARVSLFTSSDLVKEGIPRDIVDSLPRGNIDDDRREYRHYMQDETVWPTREVSSDSSQDMIEVSECYMNLDIDEDGIAEFVKIRVAGESVPSNILSIEEMDLDDHPFLACSAIMMPHKYSGLSIYDRLIQIEQHKTSLMRNIQDNLYLQNNQRTVVGMGKGRVNLDDLMVSRPGGLIRADDVDAVKPLITPQIGQEAYQQLDYLDKVASGRTGVTPDAQMHTDAVGSAVGSLGVERLLTAKEELRNLMIRSIGESLVGPMMLLIRDQLRKHSDGVQDYNYRGEWKKIRPSQWSKRKTATVRVGTGSGNTKEQQGVLTKLLMIQKEIQAMPGQQMVKPEHIYNSVKSLLKMGGLNNTDAYIADPNSPQAQQGAQQASQQQQQEKQQQQQQEQMMLEAQTTIAKAEQMKAEVAGQKAQMQGQIDSLKLQLENAENQAKAATDDDKQSLGWAKLELDREKMLLEDATTITQMEIDANRDVSAENQANMNG